LKDNELNLFREEFNERQWDEIQIGIRNGLGLNVLIYAKPIYHSSQMREIRIGIESGLDVTVYLNRFFHSKDMKVIRNAMEEGLDIHYLVELRFNTRQREEILLGELSGVDVSCYAHEKYNEWKMMEVRLGLEKGINLCRYLETHNHNQIHQIRLGAEHNLDIHLFDDVRIKQAHMAELRMALESNLNISSIIDFKLPIDFVRARRKKLLQMRGSG
jgi:hypothetical protein